MSRVGSAAMLASVSLVLAHPASAANSNARLVGPQPDGSIVASDNQRISPAGRIVELGSPARAKALAVNPNLETRTAAVLLMDSSQADVAIFRTDTGKVLQQFRTPHNLGSFTGIAYSDDGSELIYSQDYANDVVLAKVDRVTGLLSEPRTVALPAPSDPKLFTPGVANPGGVAIAAGGVGLVAINASNALGTFDMKSARFGREIPVGNAPNHVAVQGDFAYVSNEGGRRATATDFTNLSDGTPIVVDKVNAAASTGTVSVVDIRAGRVVGTIPVGLHPVGMAIRVDRLYVANSYDDTLSVVDLRTRRTVRTLHVGTPIPGAFGAGANDLVVVDDRAYVTLGQSNAIAVVDLGGQGGAGGKADGRSRSAVRGYIPTGYHPSSIAWDPAGRQLVVADDKGLGTQGSIGSSQGVKGFNSHQDTGVVNLIPIPGADALGRMTAEVIGNNHWDSPYARVHEGVERKAKPVAIPRHIGEPSLIRHVFLVIKENRTYDQMLGDLPQGNGDAALAVFGGNVPNQKALVQRFPLLDNVYAPGRQSADGHPWIVESGSFYSNEIQSPDWVRSYPGGNSDDALTYTQRGFLWSAARRKGLSVRMYGEWSGLQVIRGNYTWADFYNTALYKESGGTQGAAVVPDGAVAESTTVPSAAAILDPGYPSFNTGIPDQYRVDYWLPLYARQVATNTVPHLTILWLPNDHTSGFTPGFPVPRSAQADNDLALGRIVDAISHSEAWKESAIFVEEDDAQNGVDHVDGHRQPVFVISPYAIAPQAPGIGKVIHTTYTAENINRSIEHILGIEPLTQFDLTAGPMFDAFQDQPDFTPFNHVVANTPLNVDPNGVIAGTAAVPVAAVRKHTPIEQAWMRASARVLRGKTDKADAVDEVFLNHAIWYASTGFARPYPGEKVVRWPRDLERAAARKPADRDD